MSSPEYDVRLSRDATKAYEALPARSRAAVRASLLRLAVEAAGGARGGKRIKTIKGARDAFHRLRVGDYRIMYDLIDDERVVLVLGIVHRGELERWLRRK